MFGKKSKYQRPQNYVSMVETNGYNAGKVYFGVGRVPGGVVMLDNKNQVQVLPTDYVKKNFQKF